VDDVPFERFNVDHVLVGPSGVFAIETKFTASDWSGGANSRFVRDAVRAADDGARKIRNLLRRHGRPCVLPVLIAWGPGARGLSISGSAIGDVLVYRGTDIDHFREELEKQPIVLNESSRNELLHELRFRVAAHQRHHAANSVR
jgi:hypothetical protein